MVRSLWATVVALGACATGSLGGGAGGGAYRVPVPLGLDLVAGVPEANPLTRPKVELGRKLFFDPELAIDRSRSCATCHRPDLYFTDGRERPVGLEGGEGRRNVPSVLNVAYGRTFFWDGRAEGLEAQVLEPIRGPDELGLGEAALIERLETRRDYRDDFEDAFGDREITPDRVARALASYLRTLRSGDAPIDRFLHGDRGALSAEAQRGFRLFTGRANCGVCHLAPLFTDHQFHNTGVSWGSTDLGRFAVTGEEADRGRFRTPSLRNVAETAPYMHDGSLATLEDVIEHYAGGGTAGPHLDEEIHPLDLTDQEKRQLVAFLKALTGGEPDTD
ncbi:MAG: cytochrome c peroxidase [Gemmatimonadota bacterium]|nr:cytochrome c peroxidase [Gemmatimonadota bacterium]